MTYAVAGQAGRIEDGTFAVVARALGHEFSNWLIRRRTERELSCLDDRMLADIGLSRGDIPAAARRAVGEPDAGPSLVAQVFERFQYARARAAMIRDLHRLPDHILADIGIERWQIVEAVDAALARPVPGATPAVVRRATGSPVHDILRNVENAARPLRQWQISRVAAGQFARLDRDTLADLGYVKGDVDWVPEVMAERKLAAANGNPARRGAA